MTRPTSGRLARAALALVALVSTVGCQTAASTSSRLDLTVTADAALALDQVAIRVTGGGRPTDYTQTLDVAMATGTPPTVAPIFSQILIPNVSSTFVATVEVRGLKANKEIVKLTVDATISANSRVEAKIALTSACQNVSCSGSLTCVDGTCRPHPTFGAADAGVPFDAKKDGATDRPRDAGGDAQTVKPECPPKMHTCPGGCVSDDDPRTCGASCTPCDPPSGGTATCDGKICGGVCPTGKQLCQGDCIDAAASCMNGCPTGKHACGNLCPSLMDVTACGPTCQSCPVPTGATQATCDGTGCDFACTTGYHKCGARCALDGDATACGTACVACPTDAHGTAQCLGGNCALTCATGYHLCGAKCVDNKDVGSCGTTSCQACQMPTGGSVTCDGTACVPACPTGMKVCLGNCIASTASCDGTCPTATHDCSGVCASNMSVDTCGTLCTGCPKPTGASATTCNGTTCGFTCGAGTHLCGTGTSARCAADNDATGCGATCVACPTDTNGTAACVSGACALMCKTGFHVCGGKCVDNKALATCGPNDSASCTACQAPSGGGTVTCDGLACVPACPNGSKVCMGACIPTGNACAGVCPTGTHNCSGFCQPDTSTTACGTTCVSCPVPAANGAAACTAGKCAIACSSGYNNCPGTTLCVPASGCCSAADCKSGPANTTAMCGTANTCSYPCASGFTPCGNACIPKGACCVDNDCAGAGGPCAGHCGTDNKCTFTSGTCPVNTCPTSTTHIVSGTCSQGTCVAGAATSCAPNQTCSGAGVCGCPSSGFRTCSNGACVPTGGNNCCSSADCAGAGTSCAGTCGSDNKCSYPSGTSCPVNTCPTSTTHIVSGTCSQGTCTPGTATSCATNQTCSAGVCSCPTSGFETCSDGACIAKGGGNCCTASECTSGAPNTVASCSSNTCSYACANPLTCANASVVCPNWSFEVALDGWKPGGGDESGVARTNARAFVGTYSLTGAFRTAASVHVPLCSAGVSANLAGKTFHARVYFDIGSLSPSLFTGNFGDNQVYAVALSTDQSTSPQRTIAQTFFDPPDSSSASGLPNSWVSLDGTIPSDAITTQAVDIGIGILLDNPPSNYTSGTFYIDDVRIF